MSNRPRATPSRPFGTSTGANTTSRAGRIARCKRYSLSPFPRSAVPGKHIIKQGFPGTAEMKRG